MRGSISMQSEVIRDLRRVGKTVDEPRPRDLITPVLLILAREEQVGAGHDVRREDAPIDRLVVRDDGNRQGRVVLAERGGSVPKRDAAL